MDKKDWRELKKEQKLATREGKQATPFIDQEKKESQTVLRPELIRQWNVAKNGTLTPYDVAPNSVKKVWWVCDQHHEWQTTVISRTKGCVCPYCSGKLVSKENSLAVTRPELAERWNAKKNESLTPFEVTDHSNKVVWWECERGHEWKTSPKGYHGCPFCG